MCFQAVVKFYNEGLKIEFDDFTIFAGNLKFLILLLLYTVHGGNQNRNFSLFF